MKPKPKRFLSFFLSFLIPFNFAGNDVGHFIQVCVYCTLHPCIRGAAVRMLPNRCLVCPEQHMVFCFYWPSESTALVTSTTPNQAQTNTSQDFEVRQRGKEQSRGQRLEVSKFLPDSQGCAPTVRYKQDHGHQGTVRYPSGNVWPWMTQSPSQHRTGETLLCPKQLQSKTGLLIPA